MDKENIANEKDIIYHLQNLSQGIVNPETIKYINKISENILNIAPFCKLFISLDENSSLLGHITVNIFGILKQNFSLLISNNPQNNNIYDEVKNLVFRCLEEKYLNMKNPEELIRRNMSDIITILILGGINYHWEECIPQLIQASINGNTFNLYYLILRALADIDYLIHYNYSEEEDYENEIYISTGERMKIKDKLINNKDIVIKYIFYIFNMINNFAEEKYINEYICAILDIIKCWTNFGLNFLKNENIAKIAYFVMDNCKIKNPQKFSNLIIESINNSNNSKIYKNFYEKGASPEKLAGKILNSIDSDEKKGLDDLLNFIFPKLLLIKENKCPSNFPDNAYNKELSKAYLNILESIIENYIYFFFNFDDPNSVILNYYQYFIRYKNRKISSLFFEGLGEIRYFINNFYRFYGLNDEQKSNFVNYFMEIIFGVLENCKYDYLNLNDISSLNKDILCKENSLDLEKSSGFFNSREKKNNDGIDDIMEVDEYRNTANDVFYNIYLILLENFGDNGASQLLKKIISPLYLNNNEKDFDLIENILFYAIGSLSEIFEIYNANLSKNIIKNVINDVLDGKISIKNQRILVDFLVLIYFYNNILANEQDIFYKIVKFLIDISKKIDNENIRQSCYIIISAVSHDKNPSIKIDINILNDLFNIYNEKYSKYHEKEISTLKEIINSILYISGISKNNSTANISTEDIPIYKKLIQKLSEPLNKEIKIYLDTYENNNNNSKIKEQLISEIIKSIVLQGEILTKLNDFNNELGYNFLKEHLDSFLILTKKILFRFYDNENLVSKIIEFYEKNSKIIGENCKNYVENVNKVFLDFFLENKGENNFKVIQILKHLYKSILTSSEKEESYLQYNNYVLSQYYIIIENLLKLISKSDMKNKNIKEKIRVLCEFHSEIFQNLIINNSEIFYQLIEKLINFLLEAINILKNLEDIEPTKELTLTYLIASFNAFILNKTLIPNYLIKENRNNSCFLSDIILSMSNIIKFKLFNKYVRIDLSKLYCNALDYNINYFCKIFEQFLLMCNIYNKSYISSIIEYLKIFANNKKNLEKMMQLVMNNIRGTEDFKQFNFLFTMATREKLNLNKE